MSYDTWKLATPPEYDECERGHVPACPPESRCSVCWPELADTLPAPSNSEKGSSEVDLIGTGPKSSSLPGKNQGDE